MEQLSLSKDNFVKTKPEFSKLKKEEFKKIFSLVSKYWPKIKIDKFYEIDQKIEVLDSNSQNYFLRTFDNNFFLLKRLSLNLDINVFLKQFLIQEWCSKKINCVPK